MTEVETRTQGSRPRPRTQKKIRGQGQGQPFRGQTLSRPRPKDTSASALQKQRSSKIFQVISTKKRFPKNFSSAPQNFNKSKNSAVLEPRTGQFSDLRPRGQGQGLDLRGQGQGLQNVSSKTSSRTPPLVDDHSLPLTLFLST